MGKETYDTIAASLVKIQAAKLEIYQNMLTDESKSPAQILGRIRDDAAAMIMEVEYQLDELPRLRVEKDALLIRQSMSQAG